MKKAWAYAMRYGDLGASSRIRHLAWARRMRQAGVPVSWQSFFANSYLRGLYRGGGRNPLEWLTGLARRICWLIFRAPRNLVVEYELLPGVPWFAERLFWTGRRIVLDFDDDVGVRYRDRPLLRGKYDRAAARAVMVTAANERLFRHFAGYNGNVFKLPTLVDREIFRCGAGKFPEFTIAWIGTPVTYRYIEEFAPVLRAVAAKVRFRLLVIASRSLEKRAVAGVEMDFVDWVKDSAEELLMRCHAGIMPLTDDDFSRGKSAFKLIQYMAAGLPAIASGVGENRNVVVEGVTGFIADTPERWTEAVAALAENEELRLTMGRNALAAAAGYTYDAWFGEYEKRLAAAFKVKL